MTALVADRYRVDGAEHDAGDGARRVRALDTLLEVPVELWRCGAPGWLAAVGRLRAASIAGCVRVFEVGDELASAEVVAAPTLARWLVAHGPPTTAQARRLVSRLEAIAGALDTAGLAVTRLAPDRIAVPDDDLAAAVILDLGAIVERPATADLAATAAIDALRRSLGVRAAPRPARVALALAAVTGMAAVATTAVVMRGGAPGRPAAGPPWRIPLGPDGHARAHLLRGPGEDEVTALARAADGTLVIAGITSGELALGAEVSPAGDVDTRAVVIAVGPDGERRWTRYLSDGRALAIADLALAGDLVYVVGSSQGPSGGVEGLIGALDVATGALRWQRRVNLIGDGSLAAIALDGQGRPYASGQVRTSPGAGNAHVGALIAAFERDGTPRWTLRCAGATAGEGAAILLRGDEVVVAGRIEGECRLGDDLTTGPTQAVDGLLITADLDGHPRTVRRIGGAGEDTIRSLAALPDGRTAMAGFSDGLADHVTAGDSDGFVATVDPATGQLGWITWLGGPSIDQVDTVRLGADGQLVAGGRVVGHAGFDEDVPRFPGHHDDAIVLTLGLDGHVASHQGWRGPGHEWINALVSDGHGLVVAGRFSDRFVAGDATLVTRGYGDGFVLVLPPR